MDVSDQEEHAETAVLAARMSVWARIWANANRRSVDDWRAELRRIYDETDGFPWDEPLSFSF